MSGVEIIRDTLRFAQDDEAEAALDRLVSALEAIVTEAERDVDPSKHHEMLVAIAEIARAGLADPNWCKRLCADPRCEHPQGWHYQGAGSCLECGCTSFLAESNWCKR